MFFLAKICNPMEMPQNNYNNDNEIKKEFLLALIHDLKNPIIAQGTIFEMLLNTPDEMPIGKFKSVFKESIKSNQELLKMLDDFLAIQHCESNFFNIQFKKIDLTVILKKLLKKFQYLLKEKNLKITLNIAMGLPKINAGEYEIKRVLTNFIANAIKHSPSNSAIKISLQYSEDQIFFKISNPYKNMSDEDKEKFFDLYKTAKNNLGHGLGLFISKKLIELHSGTVGVELTETDGITFYFSLPCNSAH